MYNLNNYYLLRTYYNGLKSCLFEGMIFTHNSIWSVNISRNQNKITQTKQKNRLNRLNRFIDELIQ